MCSCGKDYFQPPFLDYVGLSYEKFVETRRETNLVYILFETSWDYESLKPGFVTASLDTWSPERKVVTFLWSSE